MICTLTSHSHEKIKNDEALKIWIARDPIQFKALFGRASPAASGAVWSRFLPNGVKWNGSTDEAPKNVLSQSFGVGRSQK